MAAQTAKKRDWSKVRRTCGGEGCGKKCESKDMLRLTKYFGAPQSWSKNGWLCKDCYNKLMAPIREQERRARAKKLSRPDFEIDDEEYDARYKFHDEFGGERDWWMFDSGFGGY